jgi:predicted Zn-dependent protease
MKIWSLINMIPTTVYEIPTIGLTTGYVNLVNYSKIILRTEGVNYYYSNIENYGSSNKSSLSNIIFWACKSDIEPFKVIKYNNEDAGRSFNYRIENKEINNLTLQLKNENNEFILDAPDYLVALQFNFYKRDDNTIKNAIVSINKLLNEMYNTIIFAMKRLGLLQ